MSCVRSGAANDLQQQTRPGVEQRRELGDGEAAAARQAAGLAEVPLQFRRVGHGERRAVDQEGPMPAPEAFRGRGDEAADYKAEHCAEDSQGQPGAGLAGGRLGEGAAGLEREVRQGRIAMEDLDDEPEDEGEGTQEGIAAPAMPELVAERADGRLVEVGPEVLPKASQCGINTLRHRGPAASRVVWQRHDAGRLPVLSSAYPITACHQFLNATRDSSLRGPPPRLYKEV